MMEVYNQTFSIGSSRRNQMIDITSDVSKAVASSGISDGLCVVCCPHTTAAITINENADPDVVSDILLTLQQLIPHDRPGYRHIEGNSDAHVKSSLVGVSVQIPVEAGRLMLGTWQAIFFCEFDGPRNRNVCVQVFG